MKEITEFLENPAFKIYGTAIVSLFIFTIGGLIKYVFDKYREYKKRTNLRNTIILLLSKTNEELLDSESNMFKFQDSISVKQNETWGFSYKVLTYLDTFEEFNFKEVNRAFQDSEYFHFCSNQRKIKKEKAFHKMWSLVRLLKYTENRVELDLPLFIDKFKKHNNGYSDMFLFHKERFDHFVGENKAKLSTPKYSRDMISFMKEIDKTWISWNKIDDSKKFKINITYDMIIKPSLDITKKYYLTVEMARNWNSDLQKCNLEYQKIENTLSHFKKQFHIHYFNYRSVRRKMKVVINTLTDN